MKTLFIRTLVYDNLLAYVNMSKINFIKLMIVLTSVCRFYLCKTTTLVIIPKPSLYLNVVFGIRRFHTQVKGPRGHQCSQLHLHQHPKGTSKRMPATKKDERRHGDPCWGWPLLDQVIQRYGPIFSYVIDQPFVSFHYPNLFVTPSRPPQTQAVIHRPGHEAGSACVCVYKQLQELPIYISLSVSLYLTH